MQQIIAIVWYDNSTDIYCINNFWSHSLRRAYVLYNSVFVFFYKNVGNVECQRHIKTSDGMWILFFSNKFLALYKNSGNIGKLFHANTY